MLAFDGQNPHSASHCKLVLNHPLGGTTGGFVVGGCCIHDAFGPNTHSSVTGSTVVPLQKYLSKHPNASTHVLASVATNEP